MHERRGPRVHQDDDPQPLVQQQGHVGDLPVVVARMPEEMPAVVARVGALFTRSVEDFFHPYERVTEFAAAEAAR